MRPARSRPDDVTEAIPRVAPADTKELPVVAPEPLPERPSPDAAATGPIAPPPAPAPATAPVAPPTAASPSPEAPRPTAPRPAAARPAPKHRRKVLLAVGLAALAIGAGATAGTLLSGREGTPTAAPSSAAPSAAPVDASVSSLDPAGGSGFAQRGDEWRTQTYRTAAFGGLKPGVGLVLDLGSPRAVTSVTFEARTAGSTVSLRASDEAPTSDAGLRPVGGEVTASGRTVLDGRSGGTHRYWVVWVSGLGPRGDGFGATFGTPVVTGPATG